MVVAPAWRDPGDGRGPRRAGTPTLRGWRQLGLGAGRGVPVPWGGPRGVAGGKSCAPGAWEQGWRTSGSALPILGSSLRLFCSFSSSCCGPLGCLLLFMACLSFASSHQVFLASSFSSWPSCPALVISSSWPPSLHGLLVLLLSSALLGHLLFLFVAFLSFASCHQLFLATFSSSLWPSCPPRHQLFLASSWPPSPPLRGLLVLRLLSSALLGHLLFLFVAFLSFASCHQLSWPPSPVFSSCLPSLISLSSLLPPLPPLHTRDEGGGHAAACHNLYFRAGGPFFPLQPPALTMACVDVPSAWDGVVRGAPCPPSSPTCPPKPVKTNGAEPTTSSCPSRGGWDLPRGSLRRGGGM